MPEAVTVIAMFGIFVALAAHHCALSWAQDPIQTKAFARIPWSLVGAIGYVLIAGTYFYPTVRLILVFGMAIVTLWLVKTAIKLRFGCPNCQLAWIINFMIIGITIAELVHR
jgi:hypothetical protein